MGVNSCLYTRPEIPTVELEEVENQTKSLFLFRVNIVSERKSSFTFTERLKGPYSSRVDISLHATLSYTSYHISHLATLSFLLI